LPKSIPSKTSEKLVNHWVDKLKDSPELHDKVEFEVAITSYSFDFDKKMNKLIGGVLTNSEKEEFKKAHLEHTKELIKGYGAGSANKALDKINLLSSKYKDFKGAKNILYLTSMIDDCINLGTVPFAILARHGFIAKTILLSLESIGVLTKSEVNQIQSSVRTVASEMIDDMKYFQLGKMSEIDFMDKYGHLRPGTYDIMSHRYDQIDSLLDNKIPINIEQHDDLFELSKKHKHSIDKILEENDFKEFKSIDLIDYVNKAIIGREYGKFIFTRVVSEVLELIANFAKLNGLTRDEISHVPLESILDMTKISGKSNIKDQLKEISKKEKEKHNISIAIRLPQLLSDVNDVHIVPFQISHPNFITQNKITAKPVVLNSKITEVLVTGKIILIEGADPGFDWIFSKNIAGLITKYGGANSHMAIRCSEFGIPAAIGCGEQKFNAILKAGQLHLDCAAGLISTLH
jgi:phosphohistidine swiveling domain-containing protein